MKKDQNTLELSRVGRLQNTLSANLPGWQLCPGISGSFRLEWVAALLWNQWQAWRGIRNVGAKQRRYTSYTCFYVILNRTDAGGKGQGGEPVVLASCRNENIEPAETIHVGSGRHGRRSSDFNSETPVIR